jgi:CRP/FNR family transcriptional regulator, global nitrogen regulator
LKDGSIYGELILEETPRQNAFAEALTDLRAARVRKSALNEVIKRHPDFATKLLFSFSERLRQSDEVIESLLNREVSARLATLLLNLGERFGEAEGSGTLLRVRLTHQDLANMIVSTREAVSQVMSEFQRAGLIEYYATAGYPSPRSWRTHASAILSGARARQHERTPNRRGGDV